MAKSISISNKAALFALIYALREAADAIAEAFEREHGRKNTEGKIYVFIHPDKAKKRMENKHVDCFAIGIITASGEVDFKNSDILAAIAEYTSKKPGIVFDKGWVGLKGFVAPKLPPTLFLGNGAKTDNAKPMTEAIPPTTEAAKSDKAPKKAGKAAKKNAEKAEEDDIEDDATIEDDNQQA